MTFTKENVSELTNAVGELTCEQSDRYPFHTVRETYDRAFKESTRVTASSLYKNFPSIFQVSHYSRF